MSSDNDLIERYLYAITRRLPADQRSDISTELRTLISDMLEERCGALPPTAKDVRVVLTELGTPGEMVRKYTDGEGKCLIGQPYYSQYLFVLKIVFICVTGGIIVAAVLSLATGELEDAVVQTFGWIGSLAVSLAIAFSFITVLFAIFSRRGIEVEVMGSLDDLPPVPRETKVTTRGDAVVGIVFSLVAAAVFLLAPDLLNALSFRSDGIPLDPFNIEVIRASAWVIVAWTLLCIAGASFQLVEGRFTPRLFVVTCIVDVLAAALVVFWLTNYQIIDSQAFIQLVNSGEDKLEGPPLWAFSNMQQAFCAVVLAALAIDIGNTAVKTFRTPYAKK